MQHQRGSVFFPLLLITAGLVIWLVNSGQLPLANLAGLAYLWPLLLVFWGLDILIGYRSRWLNLLVWFSAMSLLLGLLVYGPNLGLLPSAEIQRATLREPLTDIRSATIELKLPAMPARLTALKTNDMLLEAAISYVGKYTYKTYISNLNESFIQLASEDNLWTFLSTRSSNPETACWDIALAPGVPLNLDITAGSGPAELDLRALSLRWFNLEAGSGSLDLTLPQYSPLFKGIIDAGSGSLELRFPADAAADLYLNGSSGAILITLDEGCAFQLIIEDRGSGSITLPPDLVKVESSYEETWVTPDYDKANRSVTLTVDLGSGSLKIQR